MWQQAKWIWENQEDVPNRYVRFWDVFRYEGKEKAVLKIACDSNYALWLNGTFRAFGQYADYPQDKVFDELDLTDGLTEGENRLAILVWYCGIETQQYKKGPAGLIYELSCGEKIVCASSARTLCAAAPDYRTEESVRLTVQLGWNFSYDANGADGWESKTSFAGGTNAVEREISAAFSPRPNRKLTLGALRRGTLLWRKGYRLGEGETLSKRLQTAAFTEHAEEDCDGETMVFDLGREECGFLELDLLSDRSGKIVIAYGEHLADGRVRHLIDQFDSVRNFYVEYTARPGEQRYRNPFRRLAGRYLQVYVPRSVKAEFREIGLCPTDYPAVEKPFRADTAFRQKVYDTALRTLRLCMHEHYEDCPWREQALYNMDSRNEMLYTYYGLDNPEFVASNLLLMSRGLRPDGLLSLCFPAGLDYPIPSFSLVYPVQVTEYVRRTDDLALLERVYPVMRTVVETMIARRKDGLVPNDTSGEIWNFYEWSEGMDGAGEDNITPSLDCSLNGFFSLALAAMSECAGKLARPQEETRYRSVREELHASMYRTFFVAEEGCFRTYRGKREEHRSELANSLAVLIGLGTESERRAICEKLQQGGTGWTGITLSMKVYKFDALLSVDRERYGDAVLAEIDRDFGYMLDCGATSFWETMKGEKDFCGAGSLCHGWSALPVYYYRVLIGGEAPNVIPGSERPENV